MLTFHSFHAAVVILAFLQTQQLVTGLSCPRSTGPSTVLFDVCDPGSFCVNGLVHLVYSQVEIPVCYYFGCAVFDLADCPGSNKDTSPCFVISEANGTNGTFQDAAVAGLDDSKPYTLHKDVGGNVYTYFDNNSTMLCADEGEELNFTIRNIEQYPTTEGEFYCADQTLEGRTDELVNVPCDTFCLVGYSSNFFLDKFYGVDEKICQSLGCAKLDDNGTFINDAADRLGTALQGSLTVYACDPSTFGNNPDALQAAEDQQPCNWYNPEAVNGVVDLSDQVCSDLNVVGSGFNRLPWALQYLWEFIGTLAASTVLLGILCVCLCIRRQRKKRIKGLVLVSGEESENYDKLPLKDELFILCCKSIRLKENISTANLLVLQINSFATIALLVFLNSMQGFLLSQVYNVEADELGTVTANIGLVDEIWSLVTLGFWGVLSDRIGRRLVCILGYLHVAVGLVLMPNGGQVYPGLLLMRLIYAQGVSALTSMLTALLADYIHPDDLGKASGLMGIASGLGALFAVFILVGTIPQNSCITNAYYISTLIPLIMIPVCFWGLQSHSQLQASIEDSSGKQEKLGLVNLFISGLKEAKKNTRVGLAYMAGLLARADSAIVSIFISLWVTRYYLNKDICNPEASSDNTNSSLNVCGELLANEDKVQCPAAFTQVSR